MLSTFFLGYFVIYEVGKYFLHFRKLFDLYCSDWMCVDILAWCDASNCIHLHPRISENEECEEQSKIL